MEIEPIQAFKDFERHRIMIAGPCSAESEQQVMQTARALADAGVRIFRAGIWKPRTKPGCFEGIGIPGLEWLRRVKSETGMQVTTEVANSHHVEEALRAGIDILWVGARTSANPFAVQDIADSLRGTDIPVLVKNPVSPDLDLWIGALERLSKAGIKRLAAIHRGFPTYGESIYRNAPHWQIPIELHRRIPELPILCDPSHMGGRKSLVHQLSQQALDLSADGLFIEVHINPSCALSDAGQQLTPGEFVQMCASLNTHKEPDAGESFDLGSYRNRIDQCDKELIETIVRRMEIASEIGEFKKEHNLTVLQSERYNDIVNTLSARGESQGISRQCIQTIFEAIHTESIRRQLEIVQDGNNVKKNERV